MASRADLLELKYFTENGIFCDISADGSVTTNELGYFSNAGIFWAPYNEASNILAVNLTEWGFIGKINLLTKSNVKVLNKITI
jgi:hypothetical protein